MKKFIMALAAGVAMSSVAVAADLPSRKTAPAFVAAPPALTWTGAYVGVNAGAGWKSNNNSSAWAYGVNPATTTVATTESRRRRGDDDVVTTPGSVAAYDLGGNNGTNIGVVGGLQAGYNYQVHPMFVVGVETDFQGSSMSGGSNAASRAAAFAVANPTYVVGYTGGTNVNWFGTVRGRAGIVPLMPNLMVYGTGGFAYGGISRSGTYANHSAVQTGWTAGGGVEYKITPAWSTKVEYLYTDLNGSNSNAVNAGYGLNNVNNHTRFNTVRAGLNYNFTSELLPTLAKF